MVGWGRRGTRMNDTGAEDWPRDIFEALAAQGVRQVAYVPDAHVLLGLG